MANALIPLQGRSFNPLAIDAQVAQVQHAEQQNALARFGMQEKQRAIESENALSNVYRSAVGADGQLDTGKLYTGVAQAGYGSRLPGMMKAQAETDDKLADARKKQVDAAKTVYGMQRQLAGRVLANPTMEAAAAALDEMEALGRRYGGADLSVERQQLMSLAGNPDAIRKWAAGHSLDAEKMLAKIEQVDTGGQKQIAAVDPVTGKATTTATFQKTATPDTLVREAGDERRSLRVDARARETNAAAMSKPFEVTGPDGLPVLVQQDKQGNIKPVQGFAPKAGAAKPLTDSQAKANLFGSRMQESDRILTELEGKYSPAAVNSKTAAENIPLLGGVAGMAGNSLLKGNEQQAEQAQRDFINAVLRRESGAVISNDEFSNAKKQYLPQPGDGKEVLAQKRRNRKIAIEGLMAEVPEGRRGVPSLKNPPASSQSTPAPAASGWKIERVE